MAKTEGNADSVAFYDQNADRFALDTGDVDMSALYRRFLVLLPPGGKVLDAGCGVGRDALVFAERGFTVQAFDASAEMVRFARERVGGRAEVRQMRFEEMTWRGEFDGIWACASLLHVPAFRFSAVVERIATALRPGGVCYMSFKHGTGERVVGGRHFSDHTEESLRAALHAAALEPLEMWVTSDVRPGRSGEQWLNALTTRRPFSAGAAQAGGYPVPSGATDF